MISMLVGYSYAVTYFGNKKINEKNQKYVNAVVEYNNLVEEGRVFQSASDFFTKYGIDMTEVILFEAEDNAVENLLLGFVSHVERDFVFLYPDKYYYYSNKLYIYEVCSDGVNRDIRGTGLAQRDSDLWIRGTLDIEESTLLLKADTKKSDMVFEMITLEDGSFGYELVKAYDNSSFDYLIPDYYKGLPVISVKENAFAQVTTINDLQIPNTVIHIGENAFCAGDFLGKANLVFVDGWILKDSNTIKNYKNLAIKGIADNALTYIYDTGLELPNGLKYIGRDVFQNVSLRKINIPESVEFIGDNAFSNTRVGNTYPNVLDNWLISYSGKTNMISPEIVGIVQNTLAFFPETTEVVLPDNLKFVSTTFLNSLNTVSFSISPSNQYYSVDSGCLFNKDKSVLLRYPTSGSNSSYTTPDEVNVISKYSFSGCFNLKNLYLNQVVFIDYDSMKDSSIEKIVIGNKLVATARRVVTSTSYLKSVIMDPDAPLTVFYCTAFQSETLEILALPKSLQTIKCDSVHTKQFNSLTVYLSSISLVDYTGLISLKEIYFPDEKTKQIFESKYALQRGIYRVGTYIYS